jgi:lycopene beta-cyclase
LNNPRQYDYIVAGAGCAGLSLLIHMIEARQFDGKKILLIDKDEKRRNDRTWCFWETAPGLFEPIIHHRWKKAWFHGEGFSALMPLPPYEYKLVRGIDFYEYCFSRIRQQPTIEILFGEVQQMVSDETGTFVVVNGEKIIAEYIFNSILFEKPVLKKNEYYLLQHFKGWLVETQQPVFDPREATLMDFRVGQERGTTFVYVMPFSSTRALIEYTLFTKTVLQPSEYEERLKSYIRDRLRIDSYKIIEEEFGVIPMTNHRFPVSHGHIIHIGTAGGQTKGSSGYTFRFIQKHAAAIIHELVNGRSPVVHPVKKRFHFYDSTLLHILANNTVPGSRIFTQLFQKNKPQQVLRFLDNESSLKDEWSIISSLPTGPFLKAALKQL